MARRQVMLQPPIQIGTRTTQKNEDAARIGNSWRGVVYVDLYEISAGTLTITIETCSGVETSTGGGNSWVTVGALTPTAVGSSKVAITDLGDAIRYDANVGASQTATFAIKAFLSDE